MTRASAPRFDPSRRDKALREWESQLNGRRLANLTRMQRTFFNEQLDQLEDGYQADGQLTTEIQKRISRLRTLLEASAPVRSGPWVNPLPETYVQPRR